MEGDASEDNLPQNETDEMAFRKLDATSTSSFDDDGFGMDERFTSKGPESMNYVRILCSIL